MLLAIPGIILSNRFIAFVITTSKSYDYYNKIVRFKLGKER